jgi:hypothetical protein
MDELEDLESWRAATDRRRSTILEHVCAALGAGFEPEGLVTFRDHVGPIATVRHASSGVRFRLIPGGIAIVGISDEEAAGLRGGRPLRDEPPPIENPPPPPRAARDRDAVVSLTANEKSYLDLVDAAFGYDPVAGDEFHPNLVPDEPEPDGCAGSFPVDAAVRLREVDIEAILAAHRPTTAQVRPFLIAATPLTERQAQAWIQHVRSSGVFGGYDEGRLWSQAQLQQLLARTALRIPSAVEWEYAARALTTTLTYRGDRLPIEADLETDFEHLLDPEPGDADDEAPPYDERADPDTRNGFGLYGLGALAEACSWRDVWIARGGAAVLAPWQGCGEWRLMLSGYRHEASADFAIRPCLSIPSAAAGR